MGIFVNLLEKSGLCRNRALRSVNTLEGAIAEARRCLEGDELTPMLNAHFGINQAEETPIQGEAERGRLHRRLVAPDERRHAASEDCGWRLAARG